MGQGIYRVKDGWRPGEDSAVLGSKRDLKVEISARDYERLGYAPLLENLEWGDKQQHSDSNTGSYGQRA